jgi:hypothetical protein
MILDREISDNDIGWTGMVHDQSIGDLSGYIGDLSGCDCDQMNGLECTGASSDPVCDIFASGLPRCDWDTSSTLRCDDRGNGDGGDDDDDCSICDQYNANAGAYCAGEADCVSQCYDASGTATGPCSKSADCGAGEVCRGRCQPHVCVIKPNGDPNPIATTGGINTCLVAASYSDGTGSIDLYTGDYELYALQRTRTYVAVGGNPMPCPVCGGFCVEGDRAGDICEGTCSASGTACRFDGDCPSAEECTAVSPNCPGGSCNLALVCSAGPNEGRECRSITKAGPFGSTSWDCPPNPAANLSGIGGVVPLWPTTTGASSLTASVPCTSPGFENYDCLCPDDGGAKSKPNGCGTACNAGAEFGVACAGGGGFTRCAGGSAAGAVCDEDGDCPAGACSDNPRHCVGGDAASELTACNADADCGLGGACVDACPAGRCVPLCLPSATDSEQGVCASGKVYRCTGANETWRICDRQAAESGCAATCSQSGFACDSDDDCGQGETCSGPCGLADGCEAGDDGYLGTADDVPGAGVCVEGPSSCFVNGAAASGSPMAGGAVDIVSTYCITKQVATTSNSVAGLGGPGRLRLKGVIVTNGFTSLP